MKTSGPPARSGGAPTKSVSANVAGAKGLMVSLQGLVGIRSRPRATDLLRDKRAEFGFAEGVERALVHEEGGRVADTDRLHVGPVLVQDRDHFGRADLPL